MRMIRLAVCDRSPYFLSWHLRRHRNETGVIVYGWFPRPRNWGPTLWNAMGISIDGVEQGVVDQIGPRLRWFGQPPGEHVITLHPLKGEGVSHKIQLLPEQIVLIAFKTPNWRLLDRGNTKAPVWCPPRRVAE